VKVDYPGNLSTYDVLYADRNVFTTEALDALARGAARKGDDELGLKNARNYGAPRFSEEQAVAHQHFGLVIVSCERGDVRPLPTGVAIYGDEDVRTELLPAPKVPRVEVIDELYDAVVNGKPPLHSGDWAMATMEVCLAILRSARERREVEL
jgi:phthalate 4,5-cis-dihydrodiol dehydrogenase